eukprot:14930417-Alexandrium_andersonii.AAC.1
MSDIWSLVSSTRASGAAGPPPANAGSDRLSGSCPGREPLEEPLEEAARAPTADRGTGAAAASTLACARCA